MIDDQTAARVIDQMRQTPWYRDMLESAIWKRVKQTMPDLQLLAQQARAQRVGRRVPVPRDLGARASVSSQDEPFTYQTVTESVLTVEVDARKGLLFDHQTLDDISAKTADKLARWMGNAIEDLIFRGNPAMDPQALRPPTTADDFLRQYKAGIYPQAAARRRPWPDDMSIGSPVQSGRLGCDHSRPCACTVSVSTQSYGSMLTLQDMQRAQDALAQMSLPPGVPPVYDPASLSAMGPLAMRDREIQERMRYSLLERAGCTRLGCREIHEEYHVAQLRSTFLHVGPTGQLTQFQVSDHVRSRGDPHELYGLLLQWLAVVHDKQARACPLCGEERDPDQEPIVLELPPIQTGAVSSITPTVEACSPHCATAYAMRLDMARPDPRVKPKDRPDLRDAHEQQEREQYRADRLNGRDVTDSTSMQGLRKRYWRVWDAA